MANPLDQQNKDNRDSLNINSNGSFNAQDINNTTYNYYNSLPQTDLSPIAPRQRQALINAVRHIWIDGVLKNALHYEIMLELGLQHTPQAVTPIYTSGMLRVVDQPSQPISPDQSLSDIFNKAGRSLLILGAPGAGKTTTLLQLAQQQLAEAQSDPQVPIPVIFNLSSWAQKRDPLHRWLIDELVSNYPVTRKDAQALLQHHHLLPLLDGLDEVNEQYRATCVQEINFYRQEHQPELVVCSRIKDYENLQQKLSLTHAITIQPLTPQQIDAYLARPELELAAVRELLPRDEALHELAETPLFLSIMTIAYRGLTVAELESDTSLEARQTNLFETYVAEMFKRRPLTGDYTTEQAQLWLANLAFMLQLHAQTVFHLDSVRSTWIPNKRTLRMFKLTQYTIILLATSIFLIAIIGSPVMRQIFLLIAFPLHIIMMLQMFLRGTKSGRRQQVSFWMQKLQQLNDKVEPVTAWIAPQSIKLNNYLAYLFAVASGVLPFFPLYKNQIFLDEMTTRLIMRPIGSGWQFTHITLLNFFALRSPLVNQLLDHLDANFFERRAGIYYDFDQYDEALSDCSRAIELKR